MTGPRVGSIRALRWRDAGRCESRISSSSRRSGPRRRMARCSYRSRIAVAAAPLDISPRTVSFFGDWRDWSGRSQLELPPPLPLPLAAAPKPPPPPPPAMTTNRHPGDGESYANDGVVVEDRQRGMMMTNAMMASSSSSCAAMTVAALFKQEGGGGGGGRRTQTMLPGMTMTS